MKNFQGFKWRIFVLYFSKRGFPVIAVVLWHIISCILQYTFPFPGWIRHLSVFVSYPLSSPLPTGQREPLRVGKDVSSHGMTSHLSQRENHSLYRLLCRISEQPRPMSLLFSLATAWAGITSEMQCGLELNSTFNKLFLLRLLSKSNVDLKFDVIFFPAKKKKKRRR